MNENQLNDYIKKSIIKSLQNKENDEFSKKNNEILEFLMLDKKYLMSVFIAIKNYAFTQLRNNKVEISISNAYNVLTEDIILKIIYEFYENIIKETQKSKNI